MDRSANLGRLPIKTFLAGLLLLVSAASAQDEGLYAPAPPADAAFVRVLNAGAGELTPTLGETAFGALDAGTISPYRVVLQGSAELSAGDVTSALEVEAGRFYTVLLTDEATLLEDPALQNRAQALLLLYNVSATSVSLKTADGATDVAWGRFQDPAEPMAALGAFGPDGRLLGIVHYLFHRSTWTAGWSTSSSSARCRRTARSAVAATRCSTTPTCTGTARSRPPSAASPPRSPVTRPCSCRCPRPTRAPTVAAPSPRSSTSAEPGGWSGPPSR